MGNEDIKVMGSDDWFRNRKWNSRIEAAFFEKLGRARRKEQYLRIQASYLAVPHPKDALRLLDIYFSHSDDFDHAQAHVDRADAYLALGNIDNAVASYEQALKREKEFPKLLTNAYLDLPFLVATFSIEHLYARCIEILEENRDRPTFPIDHFRWNAAMAVMLSDSGNTHGAQEFASAALDAAKHKSSGFRYHPNVGLVSKQFLVLQNRLKKLCAK